jgi:1-phosphofructokinase
MIYTLTMNPAVDYVMNLRELVKGTVNRSDSQDFFAAGKGVNVSLALKRMGIDSVAVCLCGEGFAGDEFVRRMIELLGSESVIIRVPECDMRINVKIRDGNGVTEVNGAFFADKSASDAVREKLGELKQGDILVIGGSLPEGIPAGFYAEIAAELSSNGVLVIADTSGEPLSKIVESRAAWLIAPNQQELEELELAGVRFESGNPNVLATFGEKGATLTAANKTYTCRPEKVLKGYTVGAGDALLAGFVAEYIKSKNFEKSLIAGVECAAEKINHGN